MTLFNENANMRQFQLVKFMNENNNDDHVMTKISIVLRRDKIEAPYYMNIKIRLTSCADMEDMGIIHAMDIMNHHRMYNLTKDKYDEIKSLICDAFRSESDQIKIIKKEKELKIVIMSKNCEEYRNINDTYHEVFDKLDSLIG